MQILRPKVDRERNISPSALYHLDPLQQDRPADFKAYLDGTLEVKESDSMMYGTAAHAYMFERHRVVSIGNVKYPPEAIEGVIEALLNKLDMDFDPESLASPEAVKFIADYIGSKGVKYGNYKPENLGKHIIETYDDFYKFQKKHRGTNAILVNEQELSIVADASAFLLTHPRFADVLNEEPGTKVERELYLKASILNIADIYGKPAAVKLDVVKVNYNTKVIRVVDLKLTSMTMREFFLTFKLKRKHIQFGFYALEPIQNAIKEAFGIDKNDNEWKFSYSVAVYSRTQKTGGFAEFSSTEIDQFKLAVNRLLFLAEDVTKSGDFGKSQAISKAEPWFDEIVASYLSYD